MHKIPKVLIIILMTFAARMNASAAEDAGALFCREIGIPEGLSSDKVTSLVEDGNGRLWIGTHKGVNYFDSQKITILPFFRNSRITAMFRLPGRMIVCSVSGMAEYSLKTGQWHLITEDGNAIAGVSAGISAGEELIYLRNDGVYTYKEGTPQKISGNEFGATHITVDRFGDIWESSLRSIHKLEKGTQKTTEYSLPDLGDNQNIAGLFSQSTGIVWAWTSSGDLYRYSLSNDCFVKEELHDASGNKLSTDNISCLKENVRGQIIIGYHDGVISFDSTDRIATILRYSNQSFDRLHTVTAVECSEGGDIFAGSFFNGVFIMFLAAYDVHLTKVNRPAPDGNTASTVANNIHEFEDGTLIIGTNNNSLVRLDRYGRYLGHYGEGRINLPPDVQTVVSDNQGNIWTGLQYSGMYRIDRDGNASEIIPRKGRFSGACISDIFPAGEDLLYVATENGIDMLRPSTMEATPVLLSKNECLYFGVIELGDKVIFVNYNSLISLDKSGAGQKEIPFVSDTGSTFRCGCCGPDGTLLLGTDNGEIISYDLATGLFKILNGETFKNSEISNLIIDRSGRLWATCGNRMGVFNSDGECLQSYGLASLLNRRIFNIRSSKLCRDGDIIFGTTDGIIRFSPEKLEETSQYPKSIKISGISANGFQLATLLDLGEATMTKDGEFVLPHNRSTISITCSIMDYSPFSTGSHRVQVRVKTISEQWEEAPKDLTIKSQPLRAGKYVVEWRLCSAKGDVLSTDSVTIRIRPHWMASPPIVIFYIIFAASLAYLAYLFNRRVKRRKEEQFRREESRRINDLFNTRRMELLVNMGNEFKAPISIVSSVLSSNDNTSTDLVRNNVTKMRFLVDQMLDLEKFGLTEGEGSGAKPYDFSRFVKIVCDKLIPSIEKDRIQLNLEGCDKEIPAVFDACKMELILCNMLKHLSKIALTGSSATLSVKKENEHIVLGIRGSLNPGIDANGEIGLHIANCLCDLCGYALVESVDEDGTHFSNILTIGAGSEPDGDLESLDGYDFQITERIGDSVADEGFSPSEFRDSEGHRKYSLMVVDSSDDHVELIKRSLKQDMHVRSAKSGEEALLKLSTGTFDIVLSEIDLPDISGYDLCRTIKSGEAGHTAPVILMNYGMTEQKRLMALTANADQTIEKPVSLPSLFLMIRNLLQSDEEIRNRLMEVRGLDLSSQRMNRSDDRMVEKAIAYIKTNISTNISIGGLSEALGISRSRLYEDFNRITDMTPGDFILKIKMQEACSLLEGTNLTASEISYKLGYCNPNHFTRQFKTVYGKTPIVWRKEKSESK